MLSLGSLNPLDALLAADLEKKRKIFFALKWRSLYKVRVLNQAALKLVRLYQLTLSPYIGMQCKYVPSCSQYACDCFAHYGFMKSLVLVGWRILRCNPLSRGGYDPAVKQTSH